MTMHGTTVLKPDWIAPIDSNPIAWGFLVIADGRIEWLGRELPVRYQSCRTIEMPRCALIPGLINSHCHLEFSDMRSPIEMGATFPDWIRSVVRYRREQAERADRDALALREQAIRDGIAESYRSGVRWVVDTVTAPWSANWVRSSIASLTSSVERDATSDAITIQPCFEVLDVNETRRQQTFDFAQSQLELLDRNKCRGIESPGLSPHAPYTASLCATRWTSEFMNDCSSGIISMHLAESVDELQWLSTRDGAFAEMLGPFVGHEHLSQIGSVESHLHSMATTTRSLVVHGNYLSEQAIDFIAENRDRQAIVYCPRTHQYFGHASYPLRTLLDRGIDVFLGTDSRASNPDLKLWHEMTAAARLHPDVSPQEIFRMTTIGPATFLQTSGRAGSMRQGDAANLCLIGTECSPADGAATPLLGILLAGNHEPEPLETALHRFSE